MNDGFIFEIKRATFLAGETELNVALCHSHKNKPFVTATPENITNANYNVFILEVKKDLVKLGLSSPAPSDLVINVNACSVL